MKEYAHKAYAKKGEAIVEMNYKAIDMGADGLVKVAVDPSWANLTDDASAEEKYVGDEFIEKLLSLSTPLGATACPFRHLLALKTDTLNQAPRPTKNAESA